MNGRMQMALFHLLPGRLTENDMILWVIYLLLPPKLHVQYRGYNPIGSKEY